MNKKVKTLNKYFETGDLIQSDMYSPALIESLVRSILEPIVSNNSKAVIFSRLKNIDGIDGLIKRIEYSKNIILKEFTDFDFSKFDVDEIGFIVLTTQRYNCAFLFKEKEQGKYEIYLKVNSSLVSNVYETIKSIFCINYDTEFYEYRPERRENNLMNEAVGNILKHFEEMIQENTCNVTMRENYSSREGFGSISGSEGLQNVRQIAHEIKNQLSILDIYTKIFEKKTGDMETVEPIKKSIEIIKSQIGKFKNSDAINLQEKNVKSIIQESIKLYSGVLKEKNNKLILVDEIPGFEASAFVDEEKFLIVMNNVIKNANDSTENDEIKIRLFEEDEKIKISIVNHGEPISEENRGKIFEEGYTTKKDGWGVGLSVCRKYISSQFGTFELARSDEQKTEFLIILPLAQTR